MKKHQYSFQELKARVSVIDVATYLGYQFDRSKGVAQPSFVLPSGTGEVLDRIYIKNPQDSSRQGYWRREGINNSGDVISFVREHLDEFGVTGRNDLDTINKVLHRFAGREFELKDKQREYQAYSHTTQTFDPSRWVEGISPQTRDRIFSARNIDTHTLLTFAPYIHSVQDTHQERKYTYVAFPYTIPGDDKLVGYELRGLGGFKSKASGTNSHEGMWLASFAARKEDVRNIYIAESAFDALAFYQIHRDKIDLKSSIFVSFGGSFSDRQFTGLSQVYPHARPVLLFDADTTGVMYDIRATALMSGKVVQSKIDGENVHFYIENKHFTLPLEELSAKAFREASGIDLPSSQLLVYKPYEGRKDWNDILMGSPSHTQSSNIKR
jgi:hypothetical protein